MEKNKAPIVGPPIDANVAVSKLRRGFDVITYFRTDALNIANRANGKKVNAIKNMIIHFILVIFM